MLNLLEITMKASSERRKFRDIYRDGLLHDTIPFWFPRSVDKEYGGFLTCFDRDGTLLQTDKPVWFQGRFTWMLATLYNTIEPREEWLDLARHGVDFIHKYCFDSDGRMFFSLTREGKPLRKRRYVFSEIFTVMALSAYGQAVNDNEIKDEALDLFRLVLTNLETPGILTPKTDPEVRPMKGLSIPMCMIVAAQELRKAQPNPMLDRVIDQNIAMVEHYFMKSELKCVLETVGSNGEFLDNFDGHLVTPGHAIEVGWMILEEARLRKKDSHLIDLGTKIIDWSMNIGWDQEYGGLYYYRDAKGHPSTEYWHDMKFWWPHNEAIIGSLLAYQLTGDEKYSQMHRIVHDWTYTHFPDPTYGEWYGYLHRDGTISTPLKGNMWKGFFHLPRMQWYCWQRLEEIGV
jgi:N-acylglucosamine 2-epimerase